MSNREKKRHCHLCGRRLWGGGWVYGADEAPEEAIVVCDRCQKTAPRCDVCGTPVGDHHMRLPDGRRACAHCHQTAVYDVAHAQALFERVSRIVAGQLGLRLNVGADFTLVDWQHLQRLAEKASVLPACPACTGKTGRQEIGDNAPESRVVGLFVRKGHQRVMYVLAGLPQILLVQTVAHEWAHAWQGENCPLLRDPPVREGFAEWVAYKTLQALGAVKKMALMEQQNGLYGEGLRQMLALERREGAAGVLDLLRQVE